MIWDYEKDLKLIKIFKVKSLNRKSKIKSLKKYMNNNQTRKSNNTLNNFYSINKLRPM